MNFQDVSSYLLSEDRLLTSKIEGQRTAKNQSHDIAR